MITNQKQIAEEFCSFFANEAFNLSTNLKGNISFDCCLKKVPFNSRTSFFFKPISRQDTINIVNNLKPKKSCGWDKISIDLIKNNINTLSAPLTYLINFSFSNGIFPLHCKIAVVKPFYKKGDSARFTNYIPISLLPILSKIIETVVKSQLVQYLSERDILTTAQYRFQKYRCTSDAAFALIQKINSILEHKDAVSGIFCDPSKAFDCVDHHILLEAIFLCHQGITASVV